MAVKLSKKMHHGRNVRRFREMFGRSQSELAAELGKDWNQKRVSRLEEMEELDDESIAQIAKQLKVPADAIRYFTEEAARAVISSSVTVALQSQVEAMNADLRSFVMQVFEFAAKNEQLRQQLLNIQKQKVV